MNRKLLAGLLAFMIGLPPMMADAQVQIPSLPSGSTPSAGDLILGFQSGHTVKFTFSQLGTNGPASGDLSGSYPNPTVARINGTAPASIATSGSASDLIAGSVPVARLPLATTLAAGIVKPDGTTVTIDLDGTIHSTAGGGGGSPPGGTNGQGQYNAAGVFGGITGQTSDGTNTFFGSGALRLSGSSSGTAILNAPATGGGTLALPGGSDTLAGLVAAQTFANKAISGSTNTLTNIGNSSLTNSSITIAGHAVALGGTQTLASGDLTDGATLATLTGAQSLSNKSLVAPALGTIASGNLAAGTGYLSANLSGIVPNANGGAGAITGLLKATAGVVAQAVSATDYAPATSGSAVLLGNGAGGFANATIGSGLLLTGTTLSVTSTGGNALFGTVTGNTSDDLVTMSNTTVGVKDSGIASANVATLAGVQTLSNKSMAGNVNTFSQIPSTALTVTTNVQTGTTYTALSTDGGKVVTLNNASPIAVTLAQANTAGFTAGYEPIFAPIGAGAATITTTTSKFGNGRSVLLCNPGQTCDPLSNGTDYSFTNMSLPPVANNHLVANVSGNLDYPADTTLTALIDGAISSTRGAILERGSSVWGGINPNSTAGTLFASNGTGADPSYQTAASLGLPTLAATQAFAGQNSNTPKSLSLSGATVTPDGSANNYTVTLVHASCPCTLANPSATPVAGTSGIIEVTQSATGSDAISTWGSQYLFEGGTSTIALSSAANATDVLNYYVRDATHIVLAMGPKNAAH